jgi:succinate dehydrogenase/fumarate reductase-like Fe-S protein
MKLKVRRENGDCTAAQCSEGLSPFSPAHYDTFDLAASPGATVLSLLFEARDRFDDSLAFRYSCRGAVCGSCAMLINKVPRLACRTQVASFPFVPVRVRPIKTATLRCWSSRCRTCPCSGTSSLI